MNIEVGSIPDMKMTPTRGFYLGQRHFGYLIAAVI